MALLELFKAALSEERSEGQKLQEAIDRLSTEVADLKTKIPGQGETVVAIQELLEEIKSINPTPVGDAVIEEVQTNEAITTPPLVESAPEPTTEAIPESAVLDDAVGAVFAAGDF